MIHNKDQIICSFTPTAPATPLQTPIRAPAQTPQITPSIKNSIVLNNQGLANVSINNLSNQLNDEQTKRKRSLKKFGSHHSLSTPHHCQSKKQIKQFVLPLVQEPDLSNQSKDSNTKNLACNIDRTQNRHKTCQKYVHSNNPLKINRGNTRPTPLQHCQSVQILDKSSNKSNRLSLGNLNMNKTQINNLTSKMNKQLSIDNRYTKFNHMDDKNSVKERSQKSRGKSLKFIVKKKKEEQKIIKDDCRGCQLLKNRLIQISKKFGLMSHQYRNHKNSISQQLFKLRVNTFIRIQLYQKFIEQLINQQKKILQKNIQSIHSQTTKKQPISINNSSTFSNISKTLQNCSKTKKLSFHIKDKPSIVSTTLTQQSHYEQNLHFPRLQLCLEEQQSQAEKSEREVDNMIMIIAGDRFIRDIGMERNLSRCSSLHSQHLNQSLQLYKRLTLDKNRHNYINLNEQPDTRKCKAGKIIRTNSQHKFIQYLNPNIEQLTFAINSMNDSQVMTNVIKSDIFSCNNSQQQENFKSNVTFNNFANSPGQNKDPNYVQPVFIMCGLDKQLHKNINKESIYEKQNYNSSQLQNNLKFNNFDKIQDQKLNILESSPILNRNISSPIRIELPESNEILSEHQAQNSQRQSQQNNDKNNYCINLQQCQQKQNKLQKKRSIWQSSSILFNSTISQKRQQSSQLDQKSNQQQKQKDPYKNTKFGFIYQILQRQQRLIAKENENKRLSEIKQQILMKQNIQQAKKQNKRQIEQNNRQPNLDKQKLKIKTNERNNKLKIRSKLASTQNNQQLYINSSYRISCIKQKKGQEQMVKFRELLNEFSGKL